MSNGAFYALSREDRAKSTRERQRVRCLIRKPINTHTHTERDVLGGILVVYSIPLAAYSLCWIFFLFLFSHLLLCSPPGTSGGVYISPFLSNRSWVRYSVTNKAGALMGNMSLLCSSARPSWGFISFLACFFFLFSFFFCMFLRGHRLSWRTREVTVEPGKYLVSGRPPT